MSWHPSFRAALEAAAIASLAAATVFAQANPDSLKLRNDCRLAEHVLQTGHTAPLRARASQVIGLCGSEAVSVVA